MTIPLKVGIWIRVSTDRQVKDESPEHHEQRAIQYINAKGWTLGTIYRLNGVSGKTIMKHPETQRMLSDIKSGQINCLVFSKLARLVRNTRELLEFVQIFRNAKASLISLSENIDTSTPTGMLFFTVISALAEWEREEISSRVSDSVPIRAKLGKPLGGQAIFGYSWQGKEFVINETEAPIRKLIYEIFIKTMSKKATADELNRLGYRTRKGAQFSDTTVDRLLKDTSAKGERIANYTKNTEDRKRTLLKPKSEWIIMKCPSIVSLQTWNKVNSILVEQQRKSARIGRRCEYLLSGFVKCSCSKKMYIKNTNKVYYCKSCKIKIAVRDIEEIYWSYLSDCLMNIKMLESTKNSNNIKNKEVFFEETKIKKTLLVKTLQKYASMRLDGDLSKEKFVEQIHRLHAQLLQIEALLLKAQSEIDFEQLQIKSREMLFSKVEHIVSEWNNMSFEKKRSIIESVTEQVSIGQKDIRIVFSINLSILLQVQHGDTHMLPCLRYESQHKKPMPTSYPSVTTTIGDHIRKKRMELQLLQSDVAKIFKVSTDCITYWENNRSTPQINYSPQIIDFLGYCPFEFDETTLSGRLKAYRWRNGLSCKRLGKILEVDSSTIGSWENAKCHPSKKMLEKLESLEK